MENKEPVTPDEILNTPETKWEMIRGTLAGMYYSLPIGLQFVLFLGLFLIGFYMMEFISGWLGINEWGLLIALLLINVWVFYMLSKNRHKMMGTKHPTTSTMTKGYFD